MVVESPRPALTSEEKVERRRRLLDRYGLFRTVNKLAWNWYRSRFLAAREAATVRQGLFPRQVSLAYERTVSTVVVPSINDPACIDFVRSLSPDVIAVCGTTVIKPEVFTLAPLGAINIHTGVTPEYRSADPIFWALYCGEPEKVGVTIHYIDKGIDTGPVLRQEQVPIEPSDSLASIYVRCVRRGAELYLQALADIQSGTVKTISRPGARNRAFYSIDLGIIQYVTFCWRFRGIRKHLPRTQGPSAASSSPGTQ
jgi:folate-dependent phosphoribosylglycinamide formyltransferase PurN